MNHATYCIRTTEPHQGFGVFAALGSDRARWGFAPKSDSSLSLLLLGGFRSLRAKTQFTQLLPFFFARTSSTRHVGVTISNVVFWRKPFQIVSSVVGAASILVMHMRRIVGSLTPAGCHDSVHEALPSKMKVSALCGNWRVRHQFAKNEAIRGHGKEVVEVSVHAAVNGSFGDVFHGSQVTVFGVKKSNTEKETGSV